MHSYAGNIKHFQLSCRMAWSRILSEWLIASNKTSLRTGSAGSAGIPAMSQTWNSQRILKIKITNLGASSCILKLSSNHLQSTINILSIGPWCFSNGTVLPKNKVPPNPVGYRRFRVNSLPNCQVRVSTISG